MAGQPAHLFWHITLREYVAVCRAAAKRDAQAVWSQAALMRIAYHDPKNFPAAPVGEADTPKRIDDPEMFRAILKGMAQGQRNHGN